MVSTRLINPEELELQVHRLPERDGPHFLLTIRLFQWSVLAYKLTDMDCQFVVIDV